MGLLEVELVLDGTFYDYDAHPEKRGTRNT